VNAFWITYAGLDYIMFQMVVRTKVLVNALVRVWMVWSYEHVDGCNRKKLQPHGTWAFSVCGSGELCGHEWYLTFVMNGIMLKTTSLIHRHHHNQTTLLVHCTTTHGVYFFYTDTKHFAAKAKRERERRKRNANAVSIIIVIHIYLFHNIVAQH
jgi:hypothetical protein